jgi:adenylate cyclase
MASEIERKFLVPGHLWAKEARPHGIRIIQGYLFGDETGVVRVRIMGTSAFLTIKGRNTGITRAEFEYAIPVADAGEILHQLTPPVIYKTRYVLPSRGKNWEVDVFEGPNAGLIIAELELSSEDEVFEKPAWLGEEVSHDPRYYNAYLAKHPFSTW